MKFWLRILIACLFSSPFLVNAAENVRNNSPVETGALVTQVILGLGIVTASIFLLAWIVKRLGAGALLQQGGMKVISTMPLGTREKIVLMEIENKRILIGVASGNISCLHVFDSPGDDSLAEEATEVETAEIGSKSINESEKWDFSRYLKNVLNDGSR